MLKWFGLAAAGVVAFFVLMFVLAMTPVAAATPIGSLAYAPWMPYYCCHLYSAYPSFVTHQYVVVHGGYTPYGSLAPGYYSSGGYVYHTGYATPVYAKPQYAGQIHPAAGAPPVRTTSGQIISSPPKSNSPGSAPPATNKGGSSVPGACSGQAGCTGGGGAATNKSGAGTNNPPPPSSGQSKPSGPPPATGPKPAAPPPPVSAPRPAAPPPSSGGKH